MPRLSASLAALALLGAGLAGPATAAAEYVPGGPTPQACAGPFFDRVGTDGADRLAAASQPERIYGLGGADRLSGSPTRAACLFGGGGPDLLALAPGGGIGLGETGNDVLVGSQKDDALSGGPGGDILSGRGGTDLLRGDAGVDSYDGGEGADAIVASDGRAEVVACGTGQDSVVADREDALFGCEQVRRIQGRELPARRVAPARGGRRSVFRLTFRAPAAGGPGSYVVMGAACRQSPPAVLTAVPAPGRRVRKGQAVRVGLRPPAGGWCAGVQRAVVARAPGCEPGTCFLAPPVQPIATLALRIRR